MVCIAIALVVLLSPSWPGSQVSASFPPRRQWKILSRLQQEKALQREDETRESEGSYSFLGIEERVSPPKSLPAVRPACKSEFVVDDSLFKLFVPGEQYSAIRRAREDLGDEGFSGDSKVSIKKQQFNQPGSDNKPTPIPSTNHSSTSQQDSATDSAARIPKSTREESYKDMEVGLALTTTTGYLLPPSPFEIELGNSNQEYLNNHTVSRSTPATSSGLKINKGSNTKVKIKENNNTRNNTNPPNTTVNRKSRFAVIREIPEMFGFGDSGPSVIYLQLDKGHSLPGTFPKILALPPQIKELVSIRIARPRQQLQPRQQKVQTKQNPTSAALDIENTIIRASAKVLINPASFFRVLGVAWMMGTHAFVAFSGTIRLLAPMIFVRRVLAYILYGIGDWYTGRYLRTQYLKWERQYFRYYQVPAALRSCGRVFVQSITMMIVGRVLGDVWLLPPQQSYLRRLFVGSTTNVLSTPWWSCSLSKGGCKFWCAMVWIVAVVSTGHATGWYMEAWKTPLRIQPCGDVRKRKSRRSHRRDRLALLRPMFQWLRNPDTVLPNKDTSNGGSGGSNTVYLRPFVPNRFLFPSSLQQLRILQMIAIAKQMSSGRIHTMMLFALVQEVLRDEWYRVLFLEKRVALGIAVVALYAISTGALFFTVSIVSGACALLLLPSLLGVIVSTWMNVYAYFERRSK